MLPRRRLFAALQESRIARLQKQCFAIFCTLAVGRHSHPSASLGNSSSNRSGGCRLAGGVSVDVKTLSEREREKLTRKLVQVQP